MEARDEFSRGASRGAPLGDDESKRLQSLYALDILDSTPQERFDRLTRLACRLFNVPMALVSLVDSDRQWFKSRVGMDVTETPRAHSFCAHAILDEEVMIVPDAKVDIRFSENPMVTGAPDIRFYAGCPIKAPDGRPVGTLCVISDKPRTLEPDDERLLQDLADIVEEEIRAVAMATIDDLTGVSNRRGFEAVAHHVLGLCQRVERPATLLFFDLDGFKQVNDNFGHEVGDQVLTGFAQALLATFRDSDVVARIGGDEFCVLVSGAEAPNVQRPLGYLHARLDDWIGPQSLTFSVGVTEYDYKSHATVADWLRDADERMYAHKRTVR